MLISLSVLSAVAGLVVVAGVGGIDPRARCEWRNRIGREGASKPPRWNATGSWQQAVQGA